MSKRGENIYKRKDGRWEGRYIKERSADGKAKYAYVYIPNIAVNKLLGIEKQWASNYEEKQVSHIEIPVVI